MKTTTSILNLPQEILTAIFENLQLDDRKRVRLACKSFYNACNQVSIVSREKFVIYCEHNFCSTDMRSLLSCQYVQLNLEFSTFPANKIPDEMWKTCGERIYSLIFYDSVLNDRTIRNIIVNCFNLKHLRSPEVANYSLNPFESAMQDNIVRKNLESFEVFINPRHGTWFSIIKKIFAIYPNIKNFSVFSSESLNCHRNSQITISDYRNCRLHSPIVQSWFTVHNIVQYIGSSSSVERLRLDIQTNGFWLHNSTTWSIRLKEIRTSIHNAQLVINTLINFFCHQKLLEIICLNVDNTSEENIEKLLFHMIASSPNLRTLKFTYPSYWMIQANENELQRLHRIPLRYLHIRFNLYTFLSSIRPFKDYKMATSYKPLHTLEIESKNYLRLVATVPAEYLQNVKNLSLYNVMDYLLADYLLETVAKYQPKLEVLKFSGVTWSPYCRCDSCTRTQPQIRRSIKQFENLQCFHMSGNYLENCPCNYFADFEFPKLKHIGIFVNTQYFTINLSLLVNKAPMLEIVELVGMLIPTAQIFIFCSELEKLHYISCQPSLQTSDIYSFARIVFNMSKSLTYFTTKLKFFSFTRPSKTLFLHRRDHLSIDRFHRKCIF